MKFTPEPIDIDALPPLEIERENVKISGDRNLYRYFIAGKETAAHTVSEQQTVSLESPEPTGDTGNNRSGENN